MALSVVVALDWHRDRALRLPASCTAEQRPSGGPLYKVLLNKWYVDELYDFLFVNGLSKGGGTF